MASDNQQSPPFVRIFDSDNDGELSTIEIDNAANALRKLDRNGDGVLTASEFRFITSDPNPPSRGGDRLANREDSIAQPQGGIDPRDLKASETTGDDTSVNPVSDTVESPRATPRFGRFGGPGANSFGMRRRGGGMSGRPGGMGGNARGGQASHARPRDRKRPRDTEFKEKFAIGSKLPADLMVYNVDRQKVSINSLFDADYTVIVSGCLTCPEFRNSYPEIEALARDFTNRGVQFYFVYQSLTHPENWGFVQPSSIEDRFAQVEHAKELLQTKIPWLADTIDNDVKKHFVLTPNAQLLFDDEGSVIHRDSWGRGSSLRKLLEDKVGRPDTTTTVADLRLPRFERHLKPEGEMLVERIRLDGKSIPLRVQSGGKTPSFDELLSTDFNATNRYVKLRPEADQELLKTGTGKLYLGFRQDPVLGASWNNLADPLQFKILANGASVSPARGQSNRLEVESDDEPREFVVDVDNWSAGEPMLVKIQYFACSKSEGWCKPVTQDFTVYLEHDESAGMVNGRTHFPGGGRRRR